MIYIDREAEDKHADLHRSEARTVEERIVKHATHHLIHSSHHLTHHLIHPPHHGERVGEEWVLKRRISSILTGIHERGNFCEQ